MPKIANLFSGNQINLECDWVLKGAHATKMYDGMGYVVGDGIYYENDPLFHETLHYHGDLFKPWSYELCGPDIRGNHERQPHHILIPHGRFIYQTLTEQEVSYEAVKRFLAGRNTQGIVFWEDIWDYTCRKAKVTQADFGMKRNMKGDQE